MNDFINNFRESTIEDSQNKTAGGRSKMIKASIQNAEESVFNQDLRAIAEKFGSTAASAAAAAADDPNADIFREMIRNELRVTEQMIAFKNNNGDVVHYPADKSKREYKFGNFTIQTQSDSPIPGELTVTFGVGDDDKLRTNFTLELSMSSITPELIACMQNIEKDPFAEIDSIASSKSFFGASKMVITGTLTERQAWDKKISTFYLNGFVHKFMKQYEICLEPSSAQMAQMRVAGPDDVARMIESQIVMLGKRSNTMSQDEKTKFESLIQRFKMADHTNLELLNQISIEMDKLADDRRARIYPVAKGAKGGKTRRKNRIRMHRH
jgi:hypothetical protein